MLRLHHIFLQSQIAFLTIIFLLSSLISFYPIKAMQIRETKKELESQIELAALLLQGGNDLQERINQIAASTGHRVTLIAQNGKVLGESDKDKEKMDNHKDRPEIQMSAYRTYGSSLRHSDTIDSDMIYVAKRIQWHDNLVFLRIAADFGIIKAEIYNLWLKTAIIFAFALAISIAVSFFINRRIRDEIAKIQVFLSSLERKDFGATLKLGFAKEFHKLERSLVSLSKKLKKADKKRNKYFAKVKLKNRQSLQIIEAIGHEFKNPVAAIMGYAQTLAEDENIDRKIMHRFLQKIYSNSQAISEMIDRISFATKLENHDITLRISGFRLDELTEEITQMLSHKHPGRQIEVQVPSVTVSGDRMLIKLGLTNLIDNALKYSQDIVTVKASSDEQLASIWVIDRGMGIEPEQLGKITKKFYKLDRYSWDNSLGLGLWVVKDILKLHNRELKIESQQGLGSRFGFVLPVNETPHTKRDNHNGKSVQTPGTSGEDLQ